MHRIRRIFQTVQWKIVIIYISLILIAMQVIGIYFIRTVEQSFIDNFTETLNAQADSIAFNVEPYLSSDQGGEAAEQDNMGDLIQNFMTLTNAGAQVIDQNGVIIGGTESEKNLVGQKNVQIEVNRALLGSRGNDIRSDSLSGQRIMVLAVPIEGNDHRVLGAVYMWASMKDMYATIRRINSIFATGTVFALLLTAGLGVLLSRSITNPVKAITEQATAMAKGDFNRRVKIMSDDEIGQLGKAFNHLTIRLREALSQNEEERVKLASVLANMSDGVIATDERGSVVVYNRRAEEVLSRSIQRGDRLMQILPAFPPKMSWPLQKQWEVLAEVVPQEEETTTNYVKITFTPYHRQGDRAGGAIAVLQDITELEMLERQRKEFVANVSHELRTPLTTIKSYLEALEDGAMSDKELGPRFLQVTRRETDRMIRLVTDLLQMSHLDSEKTTFHKQLTALPPLLEEVMNGFAIPATKKRIRFELKVREPLPDVRVDRDQIRQVLDNLLSNAFKYTAEDGEILLTATRKNEETVEVSIRDTGIGIPKQELSRIFERFYRVDKARSRSMGGTGLGLAIAREIIRGQGGQIDMTSELHQGTTVSFTLPVARQEAGSWSSG